jgi:DNA-binding response OmpR family regulator
MTKKRILIVEDNTRLAKALRDSLVFEGFEVQCVHDGALALAQAEEFAPDLVVLDIMLPGKDGFELCGALRRQRRVGIIILTAMGTNDDRIRGLNLGADDYVTKPFAMKEVIARIRAVLRRTRPEFRHLKMGSVTIDFEGLKAWNEDRPIELTPLEFELLRYLAERSGIVVNRDELLQHVWGYASMPRTRTVDQAIKRLRTKIEPSPHEPRFIHSVYGTGYRLTLEDGHTS